MGLKMISLPHKLGVLHKAIVEILRNAGLETATQEARHIIEKRLQYDWSAIISKPDQEITPDNLLLIANDLAFRVQGKPLSKIYGEREFYGRMFQVNEDVLDPRQDTETIIDLALKRFNHADELRIADFGTGSGCLLITLLKEFPNATGIGIDISPKALEIAQKNACDLRVIDRVQWLISDWFDNIPLQKFDFIVSNPPYIRESVIPELSAEVRNHDPILALSGGEDGLDAYKKIFYHLKDYLSASGAAFLEIGFDQAEDVMRLGRESRFNNIGVHPDLAGLPRVIELSCGDK